jgi:hypothetical protein
LGNDDDLFAFALNTGFGPPNQLMGSFGRYQDESKLAINTLRKFHCCTPSLILPGKGLNRMSKSDGSAAD